MKKFCEFLRQQAMKTITCKNKKMKLLIKEKNSGNHTKMQKSVICCK